MELSKEDQIYIRIITGGNINCILDSLMCDIYKEDGSKLEHTELSIRDLDGNKIYQEEPREEVKTGIDENGNVVRVDENGNPVEVGQYTHSVEPPLDDKRELFFMLEKQRFWSPSDWELEKDPKRTWSDAWCRDQDALQKLKDAEERAEDKERQNSKMLETI